MASLPSYWILEAPSVLGLKPTGVELLPGRLLAERLDVRLEAKRAGQLPKTAPYSNVLDAKTRTLNAHAIADWSPKLADAVTEILDAKGFPLVLGGDCSIVLGSMLALRRRGRYGLLFIDGHADFYQAEVNPNGEAASMDLAFVTGHGPKLLTDIERRGPLVREEDVVVFGYRDAEEQAQYGSQPLPASIRALDLSTVRCLGVTRAAKEAVSHLRRHELDGFFIHLDADSVDDVLMPAVDYRLPGGLSWEELVTVLKIAIESDSAVGMEVTIYNPKLDQDGSAGRGLANALVTALATGVRPISS